jgi:exonuclease SbcC
MRLERLHLRRAPGLPRGFELSGLGPGLHLVLGPNASGKTTFCRAVRASLWPEEGFAGGEVESEWLLGGERLHARRVGDSAPAWAGARGERAAPRLPEAHLRGCFGIELGELLEGGPAEKGIASRLRLELAEGFDLSKVLKEVRGRSARSADADRGRLEEASAKLQAVEERHRELHRSETELAKLRQRQEELSSGRARWLELQSACELARAREELAGLEQELGSFPPGMASAPGDLGAWRKEVSEDLLAARQQVEQEKAELESLQAALDRLELGESESRSLSGEPWGERADALRQRLRGISEAEEDLARIREELRPLEERLSGPGQVPPPTPDAAALEKLDRAFRELEQARAAREAARQLAGESDGLESEGKAESGQEAGSLPLGWALLAAALVGLGLLALRPASESGPRTLWIALFVLLGAGGAWLLARTLRTAGIRRAAELRREEERIRREQQGRELGRAESRLEQAGRERDALLGRLGFDPAHCPAESILFAHRLVELERGRARLEGAKAALGQRRAALAAELEAAGRLLAEHRRPRPTDAQGAIAALRQLGEDAREALGLWEARPKHEQRLERALGRERQIEERRAELCRRLALEPEDEAGLDRLVAAQPRWREQSLEREDHVRQAAKLEARLGAKAELARQGSDALQAELDRRGEEEDELERLQKEIARIEAELERARREHDLEEALAALARAREALEERARALEESVLAAFLIEEVQSSHRRESQPALVRRAAAHFGRFTSERYRLQVEDRPDPSELPLQVLEDGHELALEELSAGTRVQLQLALRIATAQEAEQGEPLPLFLDEVLATSDAERFDAIAVALGELAREGRQLFHLTADQDEAQRLEEALATAGLERPMRIELPLATRAAAAAAPLAPRPRRDPPDPAGHDFDSYLRALGAPALDPFGPLESLHPIWLFLDEQDGLAEALRNGAESLGRLDRLIELGLLPGPSAQLGLRRRALEEFLESWRAGRGRPLVEEAVRSSPIGRSSLLAEVLTLALEVGWDAAALLRALRDGRVKRFQQRLADDAEREWIEQGFLDPRERLDLPGCEERVVERLASELQPGELQPLRSWIELWWRALSPDGA